jgi:hypothetical protein
VPAVLGGGAATAPLRFVHTESAAARTAKRAIVGKALERSERETLSVSCVLTFFARAKIPDCDCLYGLDRSDSRLHFNFSEERFFSCIVMSFLPQCRLFTLHFVEDV